MTAPEPNKTPKVAVVGAGLTGMLAAHGLKKNGFDVVIFDSEKHIDARPRDWTIVLHWAMPTFSKLLPESVIANLDTAICNPRLDFTPEVECLPCLNGVTGDLMFKSPMPGSRRVSRQRLRKVLSEGLDVQWDKKLVDLSSTPDHVTLSFADGSTVQADFVLGTDGPSSAVRSLLFHDDPKASIVPSGYYLATAIMQHGDAAKVEPVHNSHPVATIVMGTSSVGGIGTMYTPSPSLSTWSVFWVKIFRRGAFPDPPARYGLEALRYLKETTKDLVEPFQSQIDWAKEDDTTTCFIDEMKTWTPALGFDTHGGRVTLAGDAAHPMLPYRGQGFQHAVVDADLFVEALKAGQGLDGYNAEMVERGAKAVAQSLREAELSMDLEGVKKMMMARQGHGKSA
ncbi:hypothetical protein OQA88_13404 [Cercophora sp. LCS_1]